MLSGLLGSHKKLNYTITCQVKAYFPCQARDVLYTLYLKYCKHLYCQSVNCCKSVGFPLFGVHLGVSWHLGNTEKERPAQATCQFLGTAMPTKPKPAEFSQGPVITQNISVFIVPQRPEWRDMCLINHV